MKKIKVDKNTCIGCGTCVALAPKTFKLDDSGKSVLLNPSQDNEKTIKNAIDSCPVQAIKWEEAN